MKTNIQLLDCPFCGCKMSEKDGYFIFGDHAEDCYFTYADNQHMIDFVEKDNLIGLHEAWNKRRSRHPVKAINIDWDVDDGDNNISLPKEIDIPPGMMDIDEISDYISDVTGFCHKGFNLIEEAS